MKVVARHTSADSLSPAVAAAAHLDGLNLALYGLEIGREYTVFGLMLGESGLLVLILAGEVHRHPAFVSIELFDVSDPRLGKDWLFSHQDDPRSDVHALWGYPELVQDDANFDGLFTDPHVSAHTAFAVAARREDLSDRERKELVVHEAYVERRSQPRTPPPGF